jgi:hypothetical protein
MAKTALRPCRLLTAALDLSYDPSYKGTMKCSVLCLVVIGIAFASCVSDKDGIRVNSPRPKYADETIELKKLYTIDVTHINMFSRETRR